MYIDRYMVVQPIVFQVEYNTKISFDDFVGLVLSRLSRVVQLGSAAQADVRAQAKAFWDLNKKLAQPVPKLKRRMRTVKQKLDTFSALAKSLGGTYLHRYAQAKRTKFYGTTNTEAFVRAGKELGLDLEVQEPINPSWQWGCVYVNGLTLRGTRTKT